MFIRQNIQTLRFFRTTPAMRCPYLPHRLETKLVTELSGPDAISQHDTLTDAGFRRSHHFVYKPLCDGCRACVPVRIRVRDFEPSRAQRRIQPSQRARPRRRDPGAGDRRAVRAVLALRDGAPSRRRHGRHGFRRLSRHGRGEPGRDGDRRVPRRFSRGSAGRRLPGRLAVERRVGGLQLLRSAGSAARARHAT